MKSIEDLIHEAHVAWLDDEAMSIRNFIIAVQRDARAELERALRALCDATEARLTLIDGRSAEARDLKAAIAAAREVLKP